MAPVLESDGEEDGVGLEAADEAEACRMLVGGEIAADTFDVEAFLPVAAAAHASLTAASSSAARRSHASVFLWFSYVFLWFSYTFGSGSVAGC